MLHTTNNISRNLEKKGHNLTTSTVYSDSSVEGAALLTFSGGFLDVFTYLGHAEVFANAVTGNVPKTINIPVGFIDNLLITWHLR